MIDCTLHPFERLSARDAHDLLRLRIDVFVVEQACPYADIDGRDIEAGTRHAIARDAGRIVACARSLLPPSMDSATSPSTDTDADPRIGRVAVAATHRRRGLAGRLLSLLLADLAERLPGRAVSLDAQIEAEALYAGLGFVRSGEPFLEDGIPHVRMRRPAARTKPAQA